MSQNLQSRERSGQRGKLRIGNDWNAITIIALSQSNPLKAIAELVENSIDARATTIMIIRGRSEGSHYLEVRDNGQGVPRDADGRPDFRYVATHICDSVKRRLKLKAAPDCKVIWYRPVVVLDARRGTDADLYRRRRAHLANGDAQRRSGLFSQSQTPAL